MAPTEWRTELARVIPAERLLTQPAQLAPYESDALIAYRTHPLAVVIPKTHDEVIKVVRICHIAIQCQSRSKKIKSLVLYPARLGIQL